jgi:hypothetical protein
MGISHHLRLIMHWMNACSEPEAHRQTHSQNQDTHRDKLVAVWIEENGTPSQMDTRIPLRIAHAHNLGEIERHVVSQ